MSDCPWICPDMSASVRDSACCCRRLISGGKGRVEMWRGGLGWACLFPALSFAGASLSKPCSVSTSRSSNRTGAFNASGSRRKHHGFAHGKLRVRSASRTKPNLSCR